MFTVTMTDVLNHGLRGEGKSFTELATATLQAHAYALGIYPSSVLTGLAVTRKDGGVDLQIDAGAPSDPTGWLANPSVWQFKAEREPKYGKAELRWEVNKPYARQKIQEGYAYRLCVCDEPPPAKQAAVRAFLEELVQEINPAAPKPLLMTAGQLAALIEQVPALVVRFFAPYAAAGRHMEAWGASITALTPHYVEVDTPEQAAVRDEILHHVDFAQIPPSPVLSVEGLAGVGKTRLVYETLRRAGGPEHLVVYTDDDQKARELAVILANDPTKRAILVADECSLEARVRVESTLRGHEGRVRAVCIDNSGRRDGPAAQLHLQKLRDEDVAQILEANFPAVPADRRRAYAGVAQGYIRFAAELCRDDAWIARTAHIDPVRVGVTGYLQTALQPDGRQLALYALALVSRVGYQGEKAQELQSLCEWLDLDHDTVAHECYQLILAPGFVARAGRYLYVTPEVVAQAALELGWQRWFGLDHGSRLARIPPVLVQPFLERVGRSASEGVRSLVGEWFRGWARRLPPRALAEVEAVDRLIALAESDPRRYLPLLRDLVEAAAPEELQAISGQGHGRWGPRRVLVWYSERIAAFPEHFWDAQAVLLRLALHESETGISNNATGVWKNLFRPFLSGTAVPYFDRLRHLEGLLMGPDPAAARLALEALEKAFDPGPYTRTLGPAVVAGRIPPTDWHPGTYEEQHRAVAEALALLLRLSLEGPPGLRDKATVVVAEHLYYLLMEGFLGEVQRWYAQADLPDGLRVRVRSAGSVFCQNLREHPHPELPGAYRGQVEAWLEEIAPRDLHGRLVQAVTASPAETYRSGFREQWQAEVGRLAQELWQDPDRLEAELVTLSSPEALQAPALGAALGALDAGGVLLERLVGAARAHGGSGFVRGYLGALLERAPGSGADAAARSLLDRLEEEDPQLAYELASVGGRRTQAFERTLRLVQAGKLTPMYLQGLVWDPELSPEETASMLRLLLVSFDNPRVRRMALEGLAARVVNRPEEMRDRFLGHGEFVSLLWQVLRRTAQEPGEAEHWWDEVLKAAALTDPVQAAELAVARLLASGFHFPGTWDALLEVARQDPPRFMEALGRAALDPQTEGHFYIGRYDRVLATLPEEVVLGWLEQHGLEGARPLARHLPAPGLDAAGEPAVPSLTRKVLERFGHDERVFQEFYAGTATLEGGWGSLAVRAEARARLADRFLGDPLPVIRRWAQIASEAGRKEAAQMRIFEEERGL